MVKNVEVTNKKWILKHSVVERSYFECKFISCFKWNPNYFPFTSLSVFTRALCISWSASKHYLNGYILKNLVTWSCLYHKYSSSVVLPMHIIRIRPLMKCTLAVLFLVFSPSNFQTNTRASCDSRDKNYYSALPNEHTKVENCISADPHSSHSINHRVIE